MIRRWASLALVLLLAWPVGLGAQGLQCTNVLAISQAADTELLAGVASKRIFVCSVVLVAGAAEIINFVEGTGSVCATGKTALAGSTTDANGMSFAANGSLQIQSNVPLLWTSTAGNALCLTHSGTNRVAGFLTYAQQ